MGIVKNRTSKLKRQTITDFSHAMSSAHALFLARCPQYGHRTMTRDEWLALRTLVRFQYRAGIRSDTPMNHWIWKQSPPFPGDSDPRSDVLRWRLSRLPYRWSTEPDDSYDADIPF